MRDKEGVSERKSETERERVREIEKAKKSARESKRERHRHCVACPCFGWEGGMGLFFRGRRDTVRTSGRSNSLSGESPASLSFRLRLVRTF